MSSTIWPNKELLAAELNIALITFKLSPSITRFENPASMENSTALRHARASASSLLCTWSPLANILAITSPAEFLIIAPKPEQFKSEKTTVSKFSL